MTKQAKKPKAGHQKSKKPRKMRGSGGSGSSSGGTLTGMRSAFKGAVRGETGTVSRVIDILLWVVLGVAVAYFLYNLKCGGWSLRGNS